MCVELITFVGLFGAPKHLWWIFVKSRIVFPSLRRLPCHWRWFLALFSSFFSISCNKQNAHDKRHVSVQSLNQQSQGAGRYHFKYSTARKTLERPNIFLCPNSAPFLDGFFIILPSTAQHRKEPVVELRNARLYPGISWKSWSSLSSLPKMFGTVHYHLIYSPLDKWWV